MIKLTRGNKRILAIAAIIIVILAVAGFVAGSHYRGVLKERIPRELDAATDGLYKIDIRKININFLSRSITFKDVHLYPDSAKLAKLSADSTAPRIYADVQIPKLKVSSIMWDEITGGKGVSCSEILFNEPDIVIYKPDTAFSKYDTLSKEPGSNDLFASNLVLKNGNIRLVISSGEEQEIVLNNSNIHLKRWSFPVAPEVAAERFLLAESGEVGVDLLSYDIPGSLYQITIKNLLFDSESSKLTTRDIYFKPSVSTEEYFKSVNMQSEVYNLHFPTFEMDDIEWHRLFKEKKLIAGDVYFNNSTIDVLFNRLLPANTESKLGKYPNQLLLKLELPLYIREIFFNNANITYTEISNVTGKKGSINFSTADGSIQNVTNIPEYIDNEQSATAHMQCKFNKYSPLTATFVFSLEDTLGKFTLDAEIKNVIAHQISKQSQIFTMIAINSLNAKKMSFSMEGDATFAKSDFSMLYKNLSIKILEDETDEFGDKKQKGLLSFLANNLILYSANPMPGEKPRIIETYIERDSLKSYFNLVWKNIHQGVQKTTIRNMSVIEWIKKNEGTNTDE